MPEKPRPADQQWPTLRIDGIGHSLLTDYGTLSPDFSALRRFGAALGSAQIRASAVGGAIVAHSESETASVGRGGWAYVINRYLRNERSAAPYTPGSQLVVCRYGYNDLRQFGPRPGDLAPFKEGLRTVLSAMRQSARFEADALPAIITFNTPASWGTATGIAGQYASGDAIRYVLPANQGTPGQFTINVPSDFPGGKAAVVIGSLTSGNGNGCLWTITVDGGAPFTWDTRSVNAFDYGSSRAATGRATGVVQRITGLAAGAHTITVVPTTIVGAAYLDYVAIESDGPGPIIAVVLENRPGGATAFQTTTPYMQWTGTLNGATLVGASTFSVASPLTFAGTIRVGDTITLDTGTSAETVSVQAVSGTGPWTITPATFGTTTATTLAKAHATGVAVLGGAQDADIATLNNQMRSVVGEFNDPLVQVLGTDINDGGTFDKQTGWFYDGLHYNEVGHKEFAKLLFYWKQNLKLGLDDILTATVPDRQTWQTVLGSATLGNINFVNSWTNYGGTEPVAQYLKDTFTNRVFVRGAVKNTAQANAALTMFTLATGFRPGVDIMRPCFTANGTALIAVGAAGNVQLVSNPDASYVFFDFDFMAENP